MPCCKGWDHPSRGYSLLQRRLLQPHLPPEDIFAVRCMDVPASLDMCSLEIICRMRRLGFLRTLVMVGDASIWAILHYEGSWVRQICDDLLLGMSGDSTSCSAAATSRPTSEKQARAHRQDRVESLALRTLPGVWEAEQCPDPQRVIKQPFWCGPFARPFKSRAALATHFYQTRGRVARFWTGLQGAWATFSWSSAAAGAWEQRLGCLQTGPGHVD